MLRHGETSVAECNAEAAAAQADLLAIWDGVSAPLAGWLEAMARAFERFPDAGMVGAALLLRDGRLVAAGARIAPDGRLRPIGVGESADHPAFASVAAVEAVPLGAVMVPASVWREFGGLDLSIVVPEFAVADLAGRMRRAGLRVLCQPSARLTKATPPKTAEGWAESLGRWRVRRAEAAGGHGLAALGLQRPAAPRALFVDNFVPTADRDSGSADVHGLLRLFVSLGYHVTLLPVGDLTRADDYVEDLRQAGVCVVANGFVRSAEAYLAAEPDAFDLIMLFRGSLAGGTLLDSLQAHSPRARLVFNTVDLHFLRLERQALLTQSAGTLAQAFRAEQIELAAIARADCTLLLSDAEQSLIADLLPRARTCVVPIARAIKGRQAPFAGRRGVLFVGGFRHQPNVDAMVSFVRDVWPLVRSRLCTSLSIVGADAPPEISSLSNDGDGISVLGHVADLDAALAACRLTVAPLRFGAGLKGKIVTSLAVGVPCVASPIAVEGMNLVDGLHVRVAATSAAFADAIIDVHESEGTWTALSDHALDIATRQFSEAAARPRIAAMLRDLGLPCGAG